MPREDITLGSFEKGLFLATGPEEAPKGSYTLGSKDIDPMVEEGRVQGRPDDTKIESSTVEVGATNIHSLVKENDGSSTLIYMANDLRRLVAPFPTGTPVDIGGSGTIANVTNFTLFGKTIRGGRFDPTFAAMDPLWIGYLPAKEFFNSGAPLTPGWFLEYVSGIGFTSLFWGTPAMSSIVVSDTWGPAGGLTNGTEYVYAVAMEYDGFQVGPLQSPGSSLRGGPSGTAGSDGTLRLDLSFYDVHVLSKRMTALLVFRAEKNPSGTDLFFFAGRMPIDDNAWSTFGVNITGTFIDFGAFGASYENYTGCSETLTSNSIQYGISAMVGGYHLVAQSYVDAAIGADANFNVYRSQLNKPDMFNHIVDFARLPVFPNAIAGFQGRGYVFDANNVFRINPAIMEVEDRIQGIGCLGQQTIYTTEFGMFFADKNGIYMHTGSSLKPIGLAIAPQWKVEMASNPSVSIRYLASMQSICFIIHGDIPKIYTYHLSKERWDYWEAPVTGGTGNIMAVGGLDGLVYLNYTVAAAPYLISLATAATRKGFTLFSQLINMGRPFENKRYYGVHKKETSGSTGAILEISLDGAAYTPTPTWGALFEEARLRLTGTLNTVVTSITLVYRQLVGEKIGR